MLLKLFPTIFLCTFSLSLFSQKTNISTLKNDNLLTASTNNADNLNEKYVFKKDSLSDSTSIIISAKSVDTTSNKLSTDSLKLEKNNAFIAEQIDSIWLKTGDTLIGKITLDKDNNSFLFAKDTAAIIELNAEKVVKFVIKPKKYEDERVDVFSIFGEFYFLETNPNTSIKIYAHRTFKSVLNDGPKYFNVHNKYCLIKNDIPYFLNNSNDKEILLYLMNDCKRVMDGFKSKKYTKDNFIEAVTQYNRCNEN